MTNASNTPPEDRPVADHEAAHEDDAVIGQTFRRHLRLLTIVLALAALIAGGLTWLRRMRASTPEQTIAATAPVAPATSSDATAPALPFRDITDASGATFTHTNGARGDKLLPESMGGGVAFFDADGDDDADLLWVDGRTWPGDPAAPSGSRLLRNDGVGDDGMIRFTDVTAEAGLPNDLYATGVAVADVDGDGRRDIFLAAVGRNRLLKNIGADGSDTPRFEDVTETSGLAGREDAWSTSATFADLDRDGDLDLYVGNYVRWSKEIDFAVDYRLTGVGRAYGPPVNYQGSHSALYRNDGPDDRGRPRFTDISEAAGIEIENAASGVPVGKALGVVALDVDGNGWTDLVVANDTVRNFLFRNRGGDGDTAGDGIAFEEVGEFWGLAYGREGEATGAMGIDAGFPRDDGALGFAIGNFANEMTSLYLTQGEPTLYADESISEGIGAPSRQALTFGVLFLDVDLDGRLDLLQTNGHLETEINTVDPSQRYEQAPQLFWNAGDQGRSTFVATDEASLGDLSRPIVGRGSAYADLDGDGDLDVAMTQTGRAGIVLRNDQTTGHHWLRVRLEGRPPNRDAFGAWVELETADGRQRRPVMPVRSYQSQSELVVTFGLGTRMAIESLTVEWPDGERQSVTVDGVDRLIVVRRDG